MNNPYHAVDLESEDRSTSPAGTCPDRHFQDLPMVQTASGRDSKITQRQSWLYQTATPSHWNHAFLRDLSTVAHRPISEYGEYGQWCIHNVDLDEPTQYESPDIPIVQSAEFQPQAVASGTSNHDTIANGWPDRAESDASMAYRWHAKRSVSIKPQRRSGLYQV